MFQTIDETVTVAGKYQKGQFIPHAFVWHGRKIKVEAITLTSNTRDGGIKKRLYSIVSGADLYRLEFNRDNEQWLQIGRAHV